MKITPKEIESVAKLSGEKRYEYFIKRAADQNQIWGLWNDGWAMGETDEGTPTLPVWPAEEYAELCRTGDWHTFVPRAIPLQEFMRTVLPDLTDKGIRVSIFRLPSADSVFVSDEHLVASLKEELSKIE